jgi:death on curing protein
VRLFYVFNGRDLKAPEDDAFELVMSIARGEQLEVQRIARQLAEWVH